MIPSRERLEVAICVATHRHPEGLWRLLGGLGDLALPDPAPDLRVIVIDSDPDRSAWPVCREAAPRLGIAVEYRIEPNGGIHQTRNAALDAVRSAELIAFLDDGVVPEPGWLAGLLRIQAESGADIVTGPCLPRFEREPPDWIVRAPFFADSQRVTRNMLVRPAALAQSGTRFDEALTGGEDSDLLRRLAEAGHSVVWADTAVVREWIPAPRATAGWILRRAFRVGTTAAFVERRRTTPLRAALRSLLRGGSTILHGLASVRRGRAALGLALQRVAQGAGRLVGVTGYRYAESRPTHGS